MHTTASLFSNDYYPRTSGEQLADTRNPTSSLPEEQKQFSRSTKHQQKTLQKTSQQQQSLTNEKQIKGTQNCGQNHNLSSGETEAAPEQLPQETLSWIPSPFIE